MRLMYEKQRLKSNKKYRANGSDAMIHNQIKKQFNFEEAVGLNVLLY